MVFDYDANHCVGAAAVVANPDVSRVVAWVNHHLVVVVSTADVGQVLSGLLNDDCYVVVLFSLHVFREGAGQAGLHFSRRVRVQTVVVASVQGFAAVVDDLALNDWVGVKVLWQSVVAGVVVSAGSYVLLSLFSSPLVKDCVVLGVHLDCLDPNLSPEAVDNVQGRFTQLVLAAVSGAGLNGSSLDSRVLDLDRLVLGLVGYLDCLNLLGVGFVASCLRSLVGLPGSSRPLAALLL